LFRYKMLFFARGSAERRPTKESGRVQLVGRDSVEPISYA
jgi:hypothetical protein